MSRPKNFGHGCFLIVLPLFFIISFHYLIPFEANALTVDSSVVQFNTKNENRDKFNIRGTAEDLSLEDADAVTLEFGTFSQTIPLESFFKLGPRFIYMGGWGESGISWFFINTRGGTFSATAKRLNLSGIANPVEVQMTAGSFEGCKMLQFREKKRQLWFNKRKDEQFACGGPPEIGQVASSVFSDEDAVHPTGSMVRIDVEESSREADIVSGTIRITSASQGYDSGIQELMFGSIFYLWDTTGLNPASDYLVVVTLEDVSGQTTTDDSLVVTLAPNPPVINKLVSDLDISVPARGFPVNITRTYLLDSTFDGPLGYGWSHTYRMRIVETSTNIVRSLQLIRIDGVVQVFNADGTGSYFTPNYDGTYQSPMGDFRTLTKAADSSYQLQGKYGTRFNFDVAGKLTSIEDRNGNTQTLSYDNQGRLITITDSSRQDTTFAYDANSRITSITDPTGRIVTYGYAGAGNLTSVTNNGGFTTTYSYDANRNLTTITDPAGNRTFFTADAEDRLASVTGENGENSVTFQYSVPASDQMTVTDALGNQTVLTYDNYASVTQVVDPEGNTTQMTYDGNLNLTSMADANSGQTNLTYDNRGNLLTATDVQGNVTTLTYEAAFNQVTSLTDAKGNTTSFSFDGSGNLVTTTYPNGSSETFTYDSIGSLLSKTDRKNQTITFSYNFAGMLTQKSFPDGSSDTFDYNNSGNLVSASDENGTISLVYDSLDRLTQVGYPGGEVVSYAYDAVGNRTQLTYPDGMTLDYTYDALNRLTRISDSGQTVASYAYDALSRVTRRDLQNGTFSTYSYNNSNQLLARINRKSTSEIISSFAYTYDNVGNRLTMTTLTGTTQYTYDAINQLIGVVLPDSSATNYNLDESGNRISVTDTSGVINYTTNNLNQYTNVDGDTYSYDANGNMTEKAASSETTIYTYDYENRLIQVDTPTETVTYTYDSFGRRTSKTTSTGTTNYIHDGFRVLMEKDGAGIVQATYTHGIGIDEVLVMERGSTDYFYSQDGLGSVSDLTDSGENVIESYPYDAYGMPSNLSSVGNPYLFTGREYESETGLYYYRARYYKPQVGRFISTDPIGFVGGNNFYSYARNNPINITDPSGEIAWFYWLTTAAYWLAQNWDTLNILWDFAGTIPDIYESEMQRNFPEPLPPNNVPLPSENGSGDGGSAGDGGDTDGDGIPDDRDPDDDNDGIPDEQDPDPNNPPPDCGTDNTCAGDPTFIQISKRSAGPSRNLVTRLFHKETTVSSYGLTAKIEVPYQDSLVRGNVPVFGLAYGKNFKEYRVEYGEGRDPAEWITVAASSIPQAIEVNPSDLDDSYDLTIHGNLATWDTGLKNYVYLPSHPKDHPVNLKGTYTVRVVVTGKDDSTIEDRVTVQVANVIPNAWGGQATSKDGLVVLALPEQAIMDSFRLILIEAANNEQVDSPSERQVIGNIYKVREPGEQFTKEALLQMAYEKEEIGDALLNQLGIYGYNLKTKEWEYIDSKRDDQDNFVFAKVRKLHAYYALMASNLTSEGSGEAPVFQEGSHIQQASTIPGYGHTLVRNTFEDGLGEWSNRDNEVGATVTLDNSATFDGTRAAKITNTHVGGNFAVNTITTPFDVREYPLVQFDYRIPPEVKTNILVKVSGRWYDIGFTDDPKELKDRRVNISHIGDIDDIVADDQWHAARFNLYDMLRTKTGNTRVEAIIMADWDVGGYMKLQFGKNAKDATYYIDNFTINREVIAGLRIDSDILIVDNFNQKKATNALGGATTIFSDGRKERLETTFSEKDAVGKGHALALSYDVSDPGSYAGYVTGLQNLDLRDYQSITFFVKGAEVGQDLQVGLKDASDHESKVLLSHYLPGKMETTWQKVTIPLVAFSRVLGWGKLKNLSFSVENRLHGKGVLFVDNVEFQKEIKSFTVDNFERLDRRNSVGREQYTFVSGAAAINGQHAKGSPNGIYRLSYGGNIGTINAYASDLKSYAGWTTKLCGIDCSQCGTLSFRIRGAKGGENSSLYLADGNFRWGVDVAKYAKVTTSWQRVIIPLREFADYGADLTHLAELQFVFEGEKMSGTIYLDDICFGHEGN
ncbi:MAG: hypothetical protein JRD93_06080 [Deltaproteobacteria bacterium]|nr:hypothetical protein [Deltaproteobacteria bacterium]